MEKAKVRRIPNPVPPMGSDLGKGWKQPDANNFKFFEVASGGDRFVDIEAADMSTLHLYQWGYPTGVYAGKMWRRGDDLMWFERCCKDLGRCAARSAKIINEV